MPPRPDLGTGPVEGGGQVGVGCRGDDRFSMPRAPARQPDRQPGYLRDRSSARGSRSLIPAWLTAPSFDDSGRVVTGLDGVEATVQVNDDGDPASRTWSMRSHGPRLVLVTTTLGRKGEDHLGIEVMPLGVTSGRSAISE